MNHLNDPKNGIRITLLDMSRFLTLLSTYHQRVKLAKVGVTRRVTVFVGVSKLFLNLKGYELVLT